MTCSTEHDVLVRTRMSQMSSLFVMSMLMFDRLDVREILDLAVGAIPSLTPCRVVASWLTGDGSMLRGPNGRQITSDEVAQQLVSLDGADGPVTSSAAWVRAFAMRAVSGHCGYIIVGADEEPSEHEQSLLRMLAHQAGDAVSSAALHCKEQEGAAELRRLTVELAAVNEQLRANVVDLERRRRIHEVLMAVAVSGAGVRGIAGAVHELTDLAVAVEDRFGNIRVWAGPGSPPHSGRSTSRREEVLARVREARRPVRDRDRVVALAQSRDEVLGALALFDPGHCVGEHELVALEEGAVVLAVELTHLRALAETELRLRRDLVDDLLSGTDDESALSRSAALGHDLTVPLTVLVVSSACGLRDETVEQAVDRAVATTLHERALLARRPGGIVAIVPRPAQWCDGDPWRGLQAALARRLDSAELSIGVGGLVTAPSQVPRSYDQALRALRIRQAAVVATGVTAYDELGIYRLLADGDTVETERFVREWLGGLIDYDKANRTQLVETLWQYYECGGNYDCTARVLLIHRSTLRYRLRRIRQLTGLDLNAVESRLNMHVAVRAWRVLQGFT